MFVCLKTRAVHLKLAFKLVAFIITLIRFVGRRGALRKIYRNDGACFVGCASENSIIRRDQKKLDTASDQGESSGISILPHPVTKVVSGPT